MLNNSFLLSCARLLYQIYLSHSGKIRKFEPKGALIAGFFSLIKIKYENYSIIIRAFSFNEKSILICSFSFGIFTHPAEEPFSKNFNFDWIK